MKKLGKLNIKPGKVMKNQELKILRGGEEEWAYLCRCGFTPDYYGDCFPHVGGSLEDALQYAASTCGGHGATCFGWSQGCPD
jgi:hypothetical protein